MKSCPVKNCLLPVAATTAASNPVFKYGVTHKKITAGVGLQLFFLEI